MSQRQTRHLSTSKDDLKSAAELLSLGGLVAFPTETVYGLGADARNDIAIAQVFEAKGRPSFNPLIVHVADLDAAQKIAVFDDNAKAVAQAFWPGPLTLVLPLRDDAGISPLVTAGLNTVAIRVPDAPVARDLLHSFGGPIAAPSANPSGKISPTHAQHVAQGLDGKIDAIIDGGPCTVGVESTIISLIPEPRLLRAGGLSVEVLEQMLGPIAMPETQASTAPNAPGQLESHYAPDATMRLNADTRQEGEVLIGFGHVKDADLNLSPGEDLVEAAANLFHFLRKADEMKSKCIAVSPIPNKGLGRAINDRLSRAAAPRP